MRTTIELIGKKEETERIANEVSAYFSSEEAIANCSYLKYRSSEMDSFTSAAQNMFIVLFSISAVLLYCVLDGVLMIHGSGMIIISLIFFGVSSVISLIGIVWSICKEISNYLVGDFRLTNLLIYELYNEDDYPPVSMAKISGHTITLFRESPSIKYNRHFWLWDFKILDKETLKKKHKGIVESIDFDQQIIYVRKRA